MCFFYATRNAHKSAFVKYFSIAFAVVLEGTTIELADDFQKLIFSPTFQQVTLSNSPLRKVAVKFCKIEIGDD